MMHAAKQRGREAVLGCCMALGEFAEICGDAAVFGCNAASCRMVAMSQWWLLAGPWAIGAAAWMIEWAAAASNIETVTLISILVPTFFTWMFADSCDVAVSVQGVPGLHVVTSKAKASIAWRRRLWWRRRIACLACVRQSRATELQPIGLVQVLLAQIAAEDAAKASTAFEAGGPTPYLRPRVPSGGGESTHSSGSKGWSIQWDGLDNDEPEEMHAADAADGVRHRVKQSSVPRSSLYAQPRL